MMLNFVWKTSAVALGLTVMLGGVACDSETSEPDDEITDDLAIIPPKPDGDLVREYVVEEQIIPPGTEKQICYFLEPEKEEVYANALESYQGKFGHHLVLFSAALPEPGGTVRDCTKVEDMVNLIPIISSVNFGLEKFPEGMAIRIAQGTQMVIQQHIVNTSEKPIRVKDGMHLKLIPEEQVEILAGFYGVSDIEFVLAPEADVERTVAFDCVVPRDMNLLLMGPHMHEWGVRFTAEAGPPGGEDMKEILQIDPWFAEFRDEPPVTEWGIDDPLKLTGGDILRTTCVFNNTAGKDLEFPEEMCATYGYYFPAPKGSEAWTCAGTAAD